MSNIPHRRMLLPDQTISDSFLPVKMHMKLLIRQCSTILAYLFSLLKNQEFWSLYSPTAFLTWLIWLPQKRFVKFFHFPCSTTNGNRSLLRKFQLVYPPEGKVDNFVMLSNSAECENKEHNRKRINRLNLLGLDSCRPGEEIESIFSEQSLEKVLLESLSLSTSAFPNSPSTLEVSLRFCRELPWESLFKKLPAWEMTTDLDIERNTESTIF